MSAKKQKAASSTPAATAPAISVPRPAPNDRVFRILFWSLAALLFILMPLLSVHHGQSGDEWSLILYGNDIYDYFFADSKKALDYDSLNWLQVQGLHYYGGLYDFTVTFLHKTFFSGTDELTFRHVINSLIGALLFLYTGLLGKELGGWRAGFLALLFIALSPRLFGESMNNPKDIPFAFANVFYLYYLGRFLQAFPSNSWKYAVLMGVGFGMAMGFRIGGIIVLPYTVLFAAAFYYLNKDFKRRIQPQFSAAVKKFALAMTVVVVIGWVIGIMFWPWALQSPVSRPLSALAEMTNRQIPLQLLFEGEYISNQEVPWYYTPKWIFMSNPVLVLLSAVGAVALLGKMSRRYGRWEMFVLLFTLFFPWAYAVYKNSTIYDTWRHFFFLYPSLVLLAALFCNWAFEHFQTRRNLQWVIAAVIAIGLALPLSWTVRNHPHEYVYFNEFVGGAAGAKALYDFDYYQNGGKEMTEWIKKQSAPADGRKVIVRSNLSAIEKYFVADTAKYNAGYLRYEIRDTAEWDYYVTYSRYQPAEDLEADRWPPKDAAYIIKADGVPIGAVLKRKSQASVHGFRALSRNDYDAAIAHFGEALRSDPENANVLFIYGQLLASKGQFAPAMDALNRAKRLDATNPQIDEVIRAVGAAMQQSGVPIGSAPPPQTTP